jgi:hypothetical protein
VALVEQNGITGSNIMGKITFKPELNGYFHLSFVMYLI